MPDATPLTTTLIIELARQSRGFEWGDGQPDTRPTLLELLHQRTRQPLGLCEVAVKQAVQDGHLVEHKLGDGTTMYMRHGR